MAECVQTRTTLIAHVHVDSVGGWGLFFPLPFSLFCHVAFPQDISAENDEQKPEGKAESLAGEDDSSR